MTTQQVLKIIIFRVLAELKAEASRYFLGIFWWIIEPIIYMSVFYILFEVGLRGGSRGGSFIVFLLVGLVFWKWFASSIQTGANSLRANQSLVNQVKVPKWMFPAINFGTSTFRFLFTLVVLLIFLSFYAPPWHITNLVLPLLMLIQAILALSGAIFWASLLPFLPDLSHIISNGMLLLFFLSGIFFEVSQFPQSIQKWLYLNPMLTLIESYRDILIYFQWPHWPRLGIIALFSVLLLVFSLWNINRLSYIYPKVNRG